MSYSVIGVKLVVISFYVLFYALRRISGEQIVAASSVLPYVHPSRSSPHKFPASTGRISTKLHENFERPIGGECANQLQVLVKWFSRSHSLYSQQLPVGFQRKFMRTLSIEGECAYHLQVLVCWFSRSYDPLMNNTPIYSTNFVSTRILGVQRNVKGTFSFNARYAYHLHMLV